MLARKPITADLHRIIRVQIAEKTAREANIMLGLSGVAFLFFANRKGVIGDEARWILVMFVFVAAFGQSWAARMRIS